MYMSVLVFLTVLSLLVHMPSRRLEIPIPVLIPNLKGQENSTHWKILYIVTTLQEFDSGRRGTARGYDRLQKTLIPVLVEGIESMLRIGFEVDLVVICHYSMTRSHLIREALPASVGIEIWDNATPLGYKLEDKKHNYTQSITRALARQHRFVIKDKFPYYDHFVVFEDDMLITGEAVRNYIDVTDELSQLRKVAPERPVLSEFNFRSKFYGNLNKAQLQRMIPGFIRVEVLLNEGRYGSQTKLDPVPITDRPQVDPSICCWIHNPKAANRNRPATPKSEDLILWETNIRALGVRKMPVPSMLDWVLLQRGPRVLDVNLKIEDYWSGTDGYFMGGKNDANRYRPDERKFQYVNNQGGWMATRSQLWEWHNEICAGGFLPPFDSPDFPLDGLDKRNVEYWSGGLSIFTKQDGCNLQRIIPLEQQRFERSLLYHSANNKQVQHQKKRDILVKINDFLGQLHTVRVNAEVALHNRESALLKALNASVQA